MPPSQEQQAIIDSVLSNPFTAVSAGAGTGKTYTTVEVVVEMLLQKKATGDQFALITFTNKAATELRQRIQDRLMELANDAPDATQKIWWVKQLESLQLSFVGTIHSFCRKILLRDGYRNNKNININHAPNMQMDTFTLKQIALRILDEMVSEKDNAEITDLLLSNDSSMRVDIKDYELVQSLIKALTLLRGSGKNVEEFCQITRRQNPERGLANALHPPLPNREDQLQKERELKQSSKKNFERRIFMTKLLLKVLHQYTEHKQQENIIDQDDLLLLTKTVLSDDTELRDAVVARYPNLFVDEFQDTDNTQKLIVDALFPASGNTHNHEGLLTRRVLVVGDPKQSIYGFRGANVQLLQEFANQRNITLLPLTRSRRPTPELASRFRRLFESIDNRCLRNANNNLSFSTTSLTSSRDMNQKPTVFQGAQNTPICKQTLAKDDHIPQMVRDIQDLHTKGVPYEKMAVLVRSNRQVAQVMSHPYFQQYAQSDSQGTFWSKQEILDTLSVLKWVERGDIPTVVHIGLRTFWFTECLERLPDIQKVQAMDVTNIPGNTHITEFIRRLRHSSAYKSALHVLKELFEYTTRTDPSRKIWDKLSLSQQQNLKHLYALANDIYRKGEALTLSEFVDWIEHKVLTGQEEQDAAERYGLGISDRIKVMTIHQAKGLEFPIVFMPFTERSLKGEQYHPTVLADSTIGLDFNFEKVRALDFNEHVERLDRLRLEEELRILYVGVTRTQDQLYIYGEIKGFNNINDPYWSWFDEFIAAGL